MRTKEDRTLPVNVEVYRCDWPGCAAEAVKPSSHEVGGWMLITVFGAYSIDTGQKPPRELCVCSMHAPQLLALGGIAAAPGPTP